MFTFLPVVLILFVITVYVVYFLLTSVWLSDRKGKIIILTFLLLTSTGFIGTFVALNFYNNFVLRTLYLIFALLIGWLFYLTIAGILLRFITFFKWPVNRKKIAIIGIAIATLLFIIGLIYAILPRIKTVEIKIDNLPDQWRGQKIVQISDLHLGSIHGVNFLHKIINQVESLNPDYIFITGDLFDGHPGQVPSIGPELKGFLATKKVIFIPGNHDKYLGLDKINAFLEQANILSLVDQSVTVDGVEIIGYDFLDNKWQSNRKIKDLRSYQGQVRLLLNHTPTEINEAKDLNISLQLSGHSHRGQMWPVSFFTRLIYGKYQYGLNTEGSYNIYTTSGVGSWGPPLRTFNRPEIVQIILK